MILVTGGTGAMGARLVRGLVERGEEVRVLTLPNDPLVSRLANLSCDIRFGDVADARSLEGVLDDIETVFHLAAILLSREPEVFRRVNVEGTRNTLNAAMAASAVHFVFVSSISVTYDWPTPYSLSKRESERIVKAQTRVPWTIVRPTLAYDVGGGEEFMMFMNALMRYPIVPFIGRGSALKSPVYVEDIVRGFLAIPGNTKSHGKTYNFCGGETISLWDLAHLLLELQGVSKPFVRIPVPVCRALSALAERFMKRPVLTQNVIAGMTQHACPDPSEARADLGYAPVGVREGLARIFNEHAGHQSRR